MTEELIACTCPHCIHRTVSCKHMVAVENATDDGTLTVFSSENKENILRSDECNCNGRSDSLC